MKIPSSSVLLVLDSSAQPHSDNDYSNHTNNRNNNSWQGGSWGTELIRGEMIDMMAMTRDGPFSTFVLSADPAAVLFWDKFEQYPYTRSNEMAAFEVHDYGMMRMRIGWEPLGRDALS